MNQSWQDSIQYSFNTIKTWTFPYDAFSFYPYDNFSYTYIGEIQKLMLEIPFTPTTEDFEPQLIDLSKEELVDMIEELQQSNNFLQSQRLEERTIINSLMERLDKISRIINEEAYI